MKPIDSRDKRLHNKKTLKGEKNELTVAKLSVKDSVSIVHNFLT